MSDGPVPGSDSAGELARLLRQQREIGGPDLFLEGLTRDELLRALARTRAGGVGRRAAAPPGTAASGGSTPTRAEPGGSTPSGGPEAEVPSEPVDDLDAAIADLDYDAVRERALACTRCPLSETRTQVVFSDGSPDARLVVVGEAPGANEDREGLPFVGQAGKMLDLLLASVGLSRGEDVYICNVLKCRPPGNRNPTPAEIEACSPWLRRQIALVSPQAVLAVGSFAAQLLTGTQSALGRLRGEVYSYEGVPLVVTYHPAALLRNPGWTRPTWDDLQLLRRILDG